MALLLRQKQSKKSGFTLIELVIALLVMSGLGLMVANYMRKSSGNMTSTDVASDLASTGLLVQKMLSEDLKQVAFVNPSCDTNKAITSVTTLCSNVIVRGGITPLPGVELTAVNAMTSFGVPANISNSTASLTSSSDGLRLVLYDFTTPINCKLNSYASPNPSTTAGSATGAERFQTLREGCTGNLVVGKLYLIQESFSDNTTVYSNVFQITAVQDLGGSSTSSNQIQVDAASTGSSYNQVGGLGLSGFSSSARIYPIKLVEWAYENGGLYRREIQPSSGDLVGLGTWKLMQGGLDGIQFFPLTITTTSAIEHQRTMSYTADTSNDGIEDIRGVSPRFVLKSNRATTDGNTYDNPLTSTVENDHFPRYESKFYVDVNNANLN